MGGGGAALDPPLSRSRSFSPEAELHPKAESVRSVMSDSLPPPGTVARQAPLSLGFPRQEYWGGLPFPPPGMSGFL